MFGCPHGSTATLYTDENSSYSLKRQVQGQKMRAPAGQHQRHGILLGYAAAIGVYDTLKKKTPPDVRGVFSFLVARTGFEPVLPA